MQYVKIRDGLMLVRQPVEHPASTSVPRVLHHVLLLDRSGSMHWTIDALIDHVTERVLSLPVGDYLSVGWFSSPGDCRFVVKGVRLERDTASREALTVLLDTLRSVRNTTCFSDILTETRTVMHELAPLTPHCTLTLFTDGCPVVPDTAKEERSILATLRALQPQMGSVLLVGYGDYYNKTLMARMAEVAGGTLRHARDMPSFAVSLETFLDEARAVQGRIPVQVACHVAQGKVFSVHGEQVTLYEPDPHATVPYALTDQDDALYYLTEMPPRVATKIVLDPLATVSNASEPMVRGCYAAAAMLMQCGQASDALDVLGLLGDVALIDAANQAFTLDEYGRAEAAIQQAIASPAARFAKGRKLAYLPPADAFCVLDVLDLLLSDPAAKMYPYHPAFVYRRIGRASKTVEGYPCFTPTDTRVGVPLAGMTWHERFLNLSLRVHIPGTVPLGDDAPLLGFETPYPASIWRNFAIIRDGVLNVAHLPLTCGVAELETLARHGVVDRSALPRLANGVMDASPVVAHLEHLPVMNRAIGSQALTAQALCELVGEELRLIALLKVLRAAAKPEETPDAAPVEQDARAEYLARYGIVRGVFSPPTVKAEATDVYLSKTFAIKAKGFSALPPVAKVAEKVKLAAVLTPAERLIADGLAFVRQYVPPSGVTRDETLAAAIAGHSAQLATVRSKIHRTKFAVLLGQRWFSDLPSRADTTLTADGIQYTIEVRDGVRVEV